MEPSTIIYKAPEKGDTVHYPKYIYEGAILSIVAAALSLMLFGWMKDMTLAYGLFFFFALLAAILAIAYYVMTQMKGKHYTAPLVDSTTSSGTSPSGCGCGL